MTKAAQDNEIIQRLVPEVAVGPVMDLYFGLSALRPARLATVTIARRLLYQPVDTLVSMPHDADEGKQLLQPLMLPCLRRHVRVIRQLQFVGCTRVRAEVLPDRRL